MTQNTQPQKRARDAAVQLPGGEPEVVKPKDGQAEKVQEGQVARPPEDSKSAKIDVEAKATREEADIDAQRLNRLAVEKDTRLSPDGILPAGGEEAAREDAKKRKLGKHDYKTMRAADIDPETLTAPVMTLDGWLCPPAPEAK